MLVLTRRLGESIVIGEEIEITLLRIQGNKIRLGIVAPRETSIRRGEIEPTGPATIQSKAG